MGELSELPNIGKTVEKQLNEVGINTVDDLKKIGAKNAWLRIQKIVNRRVFIGLWHLKELYAGVKKTMLSDEVKADLKSFYQQHKINKVKAVFIYQSIKPALLY